MNPLLMVFFQTGLWKFGVCGGGARGFGEGLAKGGGRCWGGLGEGLERASLSLLETAFERRVNVPSA